MTGLSRPLLAAGAAAVGLSLTVILGGPVPLADATNLPDGRGFELVSSQNTAGNSAFQYIGGFTTVLSDDRVIWGGGVLSDGPAQSGYNQTYLASRGSGGWTNQSLLPGRIGAQDAWTLLDATPSLSASLFNVGSSVNTEAPGPTENEDQRYVYRDATGQFSTVATVPIAAQPDQLTYGGMSGAGSTIAVGSPLTLDGRASADGLQDVYLWHPGGSTQAVARSANDPLRACDVLVAGNQAVNTMSTDGGTVFVQSGSGGQGCPASSQVYRVAADGRSREISAPDPSVGPSSSPDASTFVGASGDGETAYFTTTTPLTADAGQSSTTQLYRWSVASGVTCVSCTVDALQQVNSVRVSPLGNYVYFEAPASGTSEPTLFVAHDGATEAVASDALGFSATAAGTGLQVSRTGNVVVYAPVSQQQPSAGGVYYRAVVSGSSVSAPQCVTCGVGGASGLAYTGLAGDGTVFAYQGASTAGGGGDDAVSADGDVVVFETSNQLGGSAPGPAFQIYEWTPSAGDRFVANTALSDAPDAAVTPDGHDIFFYSNARLTSDDTQPDSERLYDARVGGGFGTSPAATPCVGDSCQPAGPAPAAPGIGSVSRCCGNVSGPLASSSIAIRRPSLAAIRSAASSGRLAIRVKTRGGGRLTVSLLWTQNHRRLRLAIDRQLVRARPEGRTRDVTAALRLGRGRRRLLASARRATVVVQATLTGARPRAVSVALPAIRHSSTASSELR